jgi:hypothetical protein
MIAIGVQRQITVHDGSRKEGGFSISFFPNSKGQERTFQKCCLLGSCGRLRISAVATKYDDGEGSIFTRMIGTF